jgi:ferredoxin-NADP reductase
MSQYLHGMKIGDKIKLSSKFGHNIYDKGCFTINNLIYNVDKILMICGGSGITPMIQLIDKVMSDISDKTQLHLIFINRDEDEIILRDKLNNYNDKLTDKQIRISHLLTRQDSCESLDEIYCGRPNIDILKKIIEPPNLSVSNICMLCGSPSFNQNIKEIVQIIGYSNVFQY